VLGRRFLSDLQRLPTSARTVWGVTTLTAAHIAGRLLVLPVLVLAVAPGLPLAPLLAWPFFLLYAGAIVPAPGGGGAVELGFTAGLDSTLPLAQLAGLLIWWRWYTYYLGVTLGGLCLALAPARRLAASAHP
jgi:uncharacterized membrane protein YbhN (UPF0104 family)